MILIAEPKALLRFIPLPYDDEPRCPACLSTRVWEEDSGWKWDYESGCLDCGMVGEVLTCGRLHNDYNGPIQWALESFMSSLLVEYYEWDPEL